MTYHWYEPLKVCNTYFRACITYFVFNSVVIDFAKYLAFYLYCVEKTWNFCENFRDTAMGSSAHNFPIGCCSGTSFTLRRYNSISADAYSAQLNVRKNVGVPYSRVIIYCSSLFLINQNCFDPCTDCINVERFASKFVSCLSIIVSNCLADIPCLPKRFIKLHTPLDISFNCFYHKL